MTAKTDAVIAEQAAQTAPFIALVALDDGSGNIACAFTDANGGVYEEHQPSRIELGAAAGLGYHNTSNSIWDTEEGNRFTVRQYPTKPLTTLDPAYQLSEANRVLAIDTMAKAKLGGVACVVGCTLPVQQFYNRGDDANPVNAHRIQAKKDNLMKRCTNAYGAYDSPVILAVKVYPEAFPAYYYCASKTRKDGGKEYPEKHKTLVVDLGEFTADLAIIATGDEFIDFSTHEHGVHVMVTHLRTLLARHIDDVQAMPDAAIKEVIQRGYVGSDSESPAAIAARIDVTHLIKASADHLNKLLLADIRELARGQMHDLTRIVFVGGGANWLREQSMGWHHTVDIPEEPHLAIVRGVQLLLQANADELIAEANAILANGTAA